MDAFLIFALLLGLIILGIPVGISLLASALILVYLYGLPAMPIAHTLYQTLDSFILYLHFQFLC